MLVSVISVSYLFMRLPITESKETCGPEIREYCAKGKFLSLGHVYVTLEK